jgi:putative flippase GtrA
MHVFKFGVVGVANTAVDFAIFSALTLGAGIAPAVANVVSYSCGIGLSFWINGSWTFRDRGARRPATQLPMFVAANLAGLAISTAVVALLVKDYGPLPAKIVSVGVAFIWNFVFANFIVFRK